MNTQFEKDYKLGKESEVQSHPDLNKIFNCNLTHDPQEYAHFDFFNDNILVELKTRPRTFFKDGQFYTTTRDGRTIQIDSLYFDAPKMRFGFQMNKRLKKNNEKIKDYYIVWKCSGQYFYWKINWDKKDYFIEDQFRDMGHGYKQARDVINVYTSCIQQWCP
jgi:hypothetical protein